MNIKRNKIIFGSLNKGLFLNKELMPQPIEAYMPNWFKNIPNMTKNSYDFEYLKKQKTVKTCPSFVDMYREGYVILSPCDILIETYDDTTYKWQASINYKLQTGLDLIDQHGSLQFLEHYKNSDIKQVLKINLPIRIFTPKGYSVRQIPYSFSDNQQDFWEVPIGTLKSDIINVVNIQIFIKKHGEFLIPAGTPLCVYIPYKREKFKHEYVDLTTNNKYKDLYEKNMLDIFKHFKLNKSKYYKS